MLIYLDSYQNNRSIDVKTFDYTKWQKTYFDSIDPKQFDEALLKYSEENPHTGNAKKII